LNEEPRAPLRPSVESHLCWNSSPKNLKYSYLGTSETPFHNCRNLK